MLTPTELLLPPKFQHWVHYQAKMVEETVETLVDERILITKVPTGGGKSPLEMAVWQWLRGAGVLERGKDKLIVCTPNKGLQRQLLRDFSPMGLVNIEGKGNYKCEDLRGHTCEEAQGWCRKRQLCPAKMDYERALAADAVVTNYMYWLSVGRYGSGLAPKGCNQVGMLALDEAHLASEWVGKFMSIELTERRLETVGGRAHGKALAKSAPWEADELGEWAAWAVGARELGVRCIEELGLAIEKQYQGRPTADQIRHIEKLGAFVEDTTTISRMQEKVKGQGVDWVVETKGWQERAHGNSKSGGKHKPKKKKGRGWGNYEERPEEEYANFDVVWPGKYVERYLLRSVPKVLMLSATIIPKTGSYMGLGPGKFKYKAWPEVFDRRRCPIWWVRTVRLNQYADESILLRWVRRIDQIIGKWEGYRGVIHTHSFYRSYFFAKHSVHKHRLTEHKRGEVIDKVIAEWQLDIQGVVVSPSLGTGFDFKQDQCRFQVVGKVPYPEAGSRVMRERMKQDPRYSSYKAGLDFEQIVGRPMREESDWCATYVVDDSIGYFIAQNKDLMSEEIVKAVVCTEMAIRGKESVRI